MAIGVGLYTGDFNTDQDEQAFYDEKNSRLIEKWYLVRISNFNWKCIKLIFIIAFAL